MMGPTGIPGAAASFDPRQPPSPPQRIDREAPWRFRDHSGPLPAAWSAVGSWPRPEDHQSGRGVKAYQYFEQSQSWCKRL